MTLKKLIGLCEHKWETIATNMIVNERGDKIRDKYHLQCKICGDMTSRQI